MILSGSGIQSFLPGGFEAGGVGGDFVGSEGFFAEVVVFPLLAALVALVEADGFSRGGEDDVVFDEQVRGAFVEEHAVVGRAAESRSQPSQGPAKSNPIQSADHPIHRVTILFHPLRR